MPPCALTQPAPGRVGAPCAGPRRRVHCRAGSDNFEAREARRKAALEDELRDAASPFEALLPRPVRRTALVALAGGAAVSLALELRRGAESPALSAAQGDVRDLVVNVAVLAAAAAALAAEASGEDARRESRAAGRDRQLKAGDRETATLPDGSSYEKLKQVDDKWIVKRLERWGEKDNLPFVASAKGAALQALVRERRPRAVLEIGTALGYSAIRMAQALPDDECTVTTVERDLTYVLSARRFLWCAATFWIARRHGVLASRTRLPCRQCNQGERAPGEPRIGRRVRVEWGDAAAVLPKLRAAGRRFDFLFVDGTPADTLAHVRAAEPLLLPGATVVANNTVVFAKSLAPHVEYVRSDPRYAASQALPAPFGWQGDVPDALEVSTWRGPPPAE